MVISISDNNDNASRASRAANELGVETIVLSRKDGSRVKALTDLWIVIPNDSKARIQEAHILIGQILCDLI